MQDKTMSDEIKPCPFCGAAPELQVEEPRGGFNKDAWAAWARVKCRRCWVKPQVGADAETGYYSREAPYHWVKTRSLEEAMEKAKETAIRFWNERPKP
jgi:hypothetical protein